MGDVRSFPRLQKIIHVLHLKRNTSAFLSETAKQSQDPLFGSRDILEPALRNSGEKISPTSVTEKMLHAFGRYFSPHRNAQAGPTGNCFVAAPCLMTMRPLGI